MARKGARRLFLLLAAGACLWLLADGTGAAGRVAGWFRDDVASEPSAEAGVSEDALLEDMRVKAVLRGLPGIERSRSGTGRIAGAVALHDPAGAPKPLPGVEVVALAVEGGRETRSTARTDDAGAFALESLAVSGGWAVVVRHAPWREVVLRGVAVSCDRTTEVGTLLLGAPTTLGGEVVDAAGRPVPGALVQVFADARNPQVFDVRRGLIELEAAVDPLGASQADGEGRFSVTSLPPGRYVLRVQAPGYATQFREGVLVSRDELSTPVRVILDPGAGWHGHVLDEEGEGIGGARVIAVAIPGMGLARLDRVETRSGPDGAWRLDGLVPGVRYFLEAWAEGFSPAGRVLTPEGVKELDLVLVRSGSVRGTVTDATSGAGLAGAEVTLLAGMTNSLSPVSTVTDERGSYLLPHVSPGPVFLFFAKAPGHQAVSLEGKRVAGRFVAAGETLVLDAALPAGGAVSGRVTSESRPVPYATVALADPRRRWEGEHTAITGADGRYRIDGLRPASYDVLVSAPGLAPAVDGEDAHVVVPEDLREVVKDLVLTHGADLHGRVLSPDGVPVGGTRLSLTSAQAAVRARVRDLSAVSGADGGWRIRGVPPRAEVVLEAAHDEWAPTSLPAVRLEAGEDREVEVRLRAGASLAGRAVDARGRAVEGARVRWGPIGPEDEGRLGDSFRADEVLGTRVLRTDADGRFRIDRLAAGRLAVKVEADGYADWFRSDLVVAGEGEPPPLAVELAGASRITGRVLDARTGAAVRDAWVYAKEQRPGESEPQDPGRVRALVSVQTAADGSFTLDRVPPGRFEVVVWLAVGYAAAAQDWRNPTSRRTDVAAGTTGLEFRLEPEAAPGGG